MPYPIFWGISLGIPGPIFLSGQDLHNVELKHDIKSSAFDIFLREGRKEMEQGTGHTGARKGWGGEDGSKKNPNCGVQMLYLATAVSEFYSEKTQIRFDLRATELKH